MAEDSDIVRRVLAGNREAFGALVERHAPALLAWLSWYVPDAAEREDVAQETFLAAWRRLSTYDAVRGSFRGWLLTIGRSLARNARRRRRPQPVANPDPGGPTNPASESPPFERLDAAVRALPEDQRFVFLLAEIHEVPLAEVARLAAVPLGTVKSRLGRARERLRRVLARTGEEVGR